jgi:hypothetical protein
MVTENFVLSLIDGAMAFERHLDIQPISQSFKVVDSNIILFSFHRFALVCNQEQILQAYTLRPAVSQGPLGRNLK